MDTCHNDQCMCMCKSIATESMKLWQCASDGCHITREQKHHTDIDRSYDQELPSGGGGIRAHRVQ